jgi:hypothetical protein
MSPTTSPHLYHFRARKLTSSVSLIRSQLVVVDVINPQGLDQPISDMDRCETAYQIELIQYPAEHLHMNTRLQWDSRLEPTYAGTSKTDTLIRCNNPSS